MASLMTIVSGVLIFAVSQIFLEFFVKARKDLIRVRSEISVILLSNPSDLINGKLSEEVCQQLTEKKADYLSQAWAILLTRNKRTQALKAAQCLNAITGYSKTGRDIDLRASDRKHLKESIENLEKYDPRIISKYYGHGEDFKL